MKELVDGIETRTIIRFEGDDSHRKEDWVTQEEPLEVQLSVYHSQWRRSIAVTMRTPGKDEELAIGFLFTEGIIESVLEIEKIRLLDENIVEVCVRNKENLNLDQSQRQFYMSSSCGICGKATLDAVSTKIPKYGANAVMSISDDTIMDLSNRLRTHQKLFAHTGGIHAAAVFNREGQLQFAFEDVGRHNAMDKAVGHALLNSLVPMSETVLLLSGRASFELLQKSAMAGIPIVVAVGAPSSLAIDLAIQTNTTLIGFLKPKSFNVYAGSHRLDT